MHRRLRLALGGVAALVLAGVLVAPVVIGGGSSPSCATTLYYAGHPYAVRKTTGPSAVQDIAIGVGVTRGCGSTLANADVRSRAGLPAARAVGLSGVTTVWVRKGVCARAPAAALLACLKR